mgnify:CR=1 FL=1
MIWEGELHKYGVHGRVCVKRPHLHVRIRGRGGVSGGRRCLHATRAVGCAGDCGGWRVNSRLLRLEEETKGAGGTVSSASRWEMSPGSSCTIERMAQFSHCFTLLRTYTCTGCDVGATREAAQNVQIARQDLAIFALADDDHCKARRLPKLLRQRECAHLDPFPHSLCHRLAIDFLPKPRRCAGYYLVKSSKDPCSRAASPASPSTNPALLWMLGTDRDPCMSRKQRYRRAPCLHHRREEHNSQQQRPHLAEDRPRSHVLSALPPRDGAFAVRLHFAPQPRPFQSLRVSLAKRRAASKSAPDPSGLCHHQRFQARLTEQGAPAPRTPASAMRALEGPASSHFTDWEVELRVALRSAGRHFHGVRLPGPLGK